MRTVLSLMLAAAAVSLASAQVLVPGDQTDPTAAKKTAQKKPENAAYRTPEALKFPYVSTYYVRPVVTTDEPAEIGFYVTDFDHSKERFLDDSFRFDVFLDVRGPEGSKVHEQKGVKSGDGRFALGRLPAGDYQVGLWARDAQGRESHRVWQEFRVRAAQDLVIPPEKVYVMTAADLKAYGIRNDGDYGRKVPVTVEPLAKGNQAEQKTNSLAAVDAYLAAHPHRPAARPGYAVYVPTTAAGKVHERSFERARVVLDAGYDTNAVEQAAIATADGLQKLLDEKAAAGFRRIVLLPGTYRLSASRTVLLPDFLTLDLNGATLKQNAFTGDHACIVRFASAEDAHLVNGTLEGDYYEHDYANSPNHSEWPMGVNITGASKHCTVERVLVKDITGYGGGNGICKDARGGLSYFVEGVGAFVPGGLNPRDGTLDESDAFRFTTDFRPLEKAKAVGRLQVSKCLGYQGRVTRSWRMTGCWYDAERRFVASETLFQYREVPIPERAAFLRVSVEAESVEAAKKAGLTICLFRYPINCAVKDCTFDRCRCVGYAASAMRNMLFDGNEFRWSGESLARCAFDAEDGWDQMQDVTFTRNWFHDNPLNNSILTCAGHNFVLERNRGGIHFWARTHSPCVRDNDVEMAGYVCGGRLRSGYGRYNEGNRYSRGVRLLVCQANSEPEWETVLRGLDFTGEPTNRLVRVERGGRLVSCRFANSDTTVGNAKDCVFDNCRGAHFPGGSWSGCVVTGGLFQAFGSSYGQPIRTNDFDSCAFTGVTFKHLRGGQQTFRDCVFRNCEFAFLAGSNVRFVRCTFVGTTLSGGYWSPPSRLGFFDCQIELGAKPLLTLGLYTIGRVGFRGCTVTAADGSKAPLLDIFDLRPLQGKDGKQWDAEDGGVAIRNCSFGLGVKKAIGVRGTRATASAKPLAFRLDGNRMADKEAVVYAPADGLPGWKINGKEARDHE